MHGPDQRCRTALKQAGIWIWPKFISGNVLKEAQAELDILAKQQIPDERGVVLISESVLRCYAMLDLIIDSRLITEMLGMKLTTWSAKRLLPHEPMTYGNCQYHHDCVPGQVKAMLLLSDVDYCGQRMDYIPGTHRYHWPNSHYAETRFTNQDALSYGYPVHCVGEAGTLILFNTNGLHRGNRSLGAVRDTLTMNYQSKWRWN